MASAFRIRTDPRLLAVALAVAPLGLLACGGKTDELGGLAARSSTPRPLDDDVTTPPRKGAEPDVEEEFPDWWDDGSCLAAGTLIETPDGPRKIETLNPGDAVLSRDDSTGLLRINPILSIKESQRAVQSVALADGRSLLATGDHLFFDPDRLEYVPLRSFVAEAEFLSLEAASRTTNGADQLQLTPASIGEPLATAPVFDLSIARDHNYFAEGILVHNKSGAGPCNNVNVKEAIICEGPGTVYTPDSHYGRIAVGSPPRDTGMGGNGTSVQDVIVVSLKLIDDECEETLAIRLDRTSDYGAFEVAHSETPCPESPDQLDWVDFELYEIDGPFAVAAPASGYLLARYSRWAVECLTAGGYGSVDLCEE